MSTSTEHALKTPAIAEEGDRVDGGRGLGRIAGIDILRGYAIISIVIYHLWDDIRHLHYSAGWFDLRFASHVRDGDWSSVPTSLLDAFLSADFRIPMFMMLSGLALYLAAAKGGLTIDRWAFYRRRLRQLLVPYWFAVGLVFVTVCLLALAQYALHGQSLVYQFQHVTEARVDYVAPGTFSFLISLTLIPRLFSAGWTVTPPAVMWFVVLLVQYYLLFPFLYVVLNRHKPLRFVIAAFAVTILAKLLLIELAGGIDHGTGSHLNHTVSIFRGFEFALGMALGYLVIHQPGRLRQVASPRAATCALVAAGLLFIVGGNLMDDGRRYYGAVAAPIAIVGVAMIALPLLVKRPGRLEAAAPSRLFASVGPLSYAVLIANEPIRLIASFLRVEQIPTGLWWLYLVAYVPLTLMLARPIASLLGIGQRQRSAPARSSSEQHVPERTALTREERVRAS